MTDSTGITTYTYDSGNRLVGRTVTRAAGPVSSLAYSYDAGGNVLTRTYPDGRTVTYGFDDASQMTGVDDGSDSQIKDRFAGLQTGPQVANRS